MQIQKVENLPSERIIAMGTFRLTRGTRAGLLTLGALALGIALIGQDMRFERTSDVGPIRVSYSELQRVIDRASAFAAKFNEKSDSVRRSESIRIGWVGGHVELKGTNISEVVSNLPKSIDSFEYNCDLISDKSDVTISISLRDYNRTLVVEGTDREEVDSIYFSLRDELEQMSSPIGGAPQRMYISVFVYMIILIVVVVALEKYERAKSRYRTVMLLSLAGALLWYGLPKEELLAGFSAMSGDANFLARYGPQISALGVLLAIIGAIRMLIVSPWHDRKKAPIAADTSDTTLPSNTRVDKVVMRKPKNKRNGDS